VKISKRDKKILKIGGAVTAVLLFMMYIVIPFIDYLQEMDIKKETLEARLVRMTRNINSEETYRQGLARINSVMELLKTNLPEGKDSETAVRELHRIITSLAEEHNVQVTRITPAKKPERFDLEAVKNNPFLAGFLKVKVTAALKCRPDHLASLLYALENHDKFLMVEKLEIRAWGVKADKMIKPNITLSTYIHDAKEASGTKNKSS